ncbi:MAG TPA: elongation factor P maturation arginine rhamnosyltransferase EarP [Rhodanobacter sp.]|nr:elongation factor P maturation arginine rhamnosyltransferase EarP [Rhodanobacter sp.]
MLWDIFCKVIDNFGDIGVCWRLSADLAARGEQVRLWVDDATALRWMAPGGCPGVTVLPWAQSLEAAGQPAADVLVEAFGCEIAPEFIAACVDEVRATGRKPVWINLEYLSAERYVERSHGLPSPVLHGPGKGLVRHFFYPGFTPRTGGLLREPDLLARRSAFDRAAWLARLGIARGGERLVSLFCYEPAALDGLLDRLASAGQPTRVLVTAGRAAAATRALIEHKNRLNPSWVKDSLLSILYLPELSQPDFDHLLWACDLNFVRGEDSLVRALWAGQPFIWQIYPQDDAAHHRKLDAFLDWLQAPASLRQFHQVWNGTSAAPLPAVDAAAWGPTVAAARVRLLAQGDLTHQLLQFVRENR